MDHPIKQEPMPSTSKDVIEMVLSDVPLINEIEGVGEIEEVQMIELESDSESPTEENLNSEDEDEDDYPTPDQNDLKIQDQEKELTNKFLNGELSFSEYAALMETDDNIIENQDSINLSTTKEIDLFAKEIASTSKNYGTTAKRRRRGNTLPPVLRGLMGEANLRYTRGEHETALKMCMEIIRQVPTAPEPFQTLAHLYEDLGCFDKFLQFALIAAHLSPNDPDQWLRLASMSENQGNLKQAITCYSKAIEADPTNSVTHLTRAALLERIGEKKNAIKAYIRLITILEPSEGPLILQLAKMVAKRFHEDGEVSKAYDVMDLAFKKCPSFIRSEDVNLILELLLSLNHYSRCLEILIQYSNIEIEAENNEITSEFRIISYKIPEELAVDLHAKFLVTLIHLKAFHILNNLVEDFFKLADPEHTGDLYLDIAEALMSENKHEFALKLLRPLIKSQNYYLPAVWLRQAECLHACGNEEEAAAAYDIVVHMAPQHLDARLILAQLYSQLGKGEDALAVLTQDENTEVLEPGLLYERTQLLKRSGLDKIEDFLAAGHLLLSRHCVNIRSQEEVEVLTRLRRSDRQKEQIKEIRANRGEPDLDPYAPDFGDTKRQPSFQEEWALLCDLCKACLERGQLARFQRLTFSALGSRVFMGSLDTFREIEFLCLLSCFYNEDYFNGYNLVRDLLVKERQFPRVWNFFNLIIQRADDVRHNRFIMRFLAKESSNINFMILHANNCLIAGTYKYALNEYANAYRLQPENPMLPFLIGVTLTQMACQKFASQKHALVTQALAFFSLYQKNRTDLGKQEVYYNLARTHHQFGLLPQAIHYYKRAINFKCTLGKNFDLTQEAAFNLYSIYKSTGATDVARHYVNKYLII